MMRRTLAATWRMAARQINNNNTLVPLLPHARMPCLVVQQEPSHRMGGVRQVSHHHQHQQHSQHKRHMKRKKKHQHDPFKVLGISKKTDYNTVKKTFLKIAMSHHPDTSQAESQEEKEKHRDVFVAARKAFESITEGPDGEAILRSESDEAWNDEELNEWFHQESGGFDMPFMDVKTRKEVSRVMDEIGGGLDRDGGMYFFILRQDGFLL